MRKNMTYRGTVVKIAIFCLIFFRKVRQKMAGFGTMEQIVKKCASNIAKRGSVRQSIIHNYSFQPKMTSIV